MDFISLFFTAVGTIASVISAYIAVKAKNETKKIKDDVVKVYKAKVINSGYNTGVISGVNLGDINND